MTNKEKFLALVSGEDTETLAEAIKRQANRSARRISQHIAIKILIQLDELGWKQNTLAQKMNVSPQQVNKWVKGGENFTIETLAKLSDVLGVELISVNLMQESTPTEEIQVTMNDEFEVHSQVIRLMPAITLNAEMSYENDYLIAN